MIFCGGRARRIAGHTNLIEATTMKNRSTVSALGLFGCSALALPLTAFAHHAMDKATPASLFEGLVSGLAHPVVGLDHLLFVLAMGAACFYFGRTALTVFTFIAATLAGTAIHLYVGALPYQELWVACSLLVLGVLLFRGHGFLRSKAALELFALFGIVHGYAYGEAIVGAETTPLLAYLTGFALVQFAIAFAGFQIARYAQRTAGSRPAAVGGALSAAGAVFLTLSLV
jgi:urease accessory protein